MVSMSNSLHDVAVTIMTMIIIRSLSPGHSAPFFDRTATSAPQGLKLSASRSSHAFDGDAVCPGPNAKASNCLPTWTTLNIVPATALLAVVEYHTGKRYERKNPAWAPQSRVFDLRDIILSTQPVHVYTYGANKLEHSSRTNTHYPGFLSGLYVRTFCLCRR